MRSNGIKLQSLAHISIRFMRKWRTCLFKNSRETNRVILIHMVKQALRKNIFPFHTILMMHNAPKLKILR